MSLGKTFNACVCVLGVYTLNAVHQVGTGVAYQWNCTYTQRTLQMFSRKSVSDMAYYFSVSILSQCSFPNLETEKLKTIIFLLSCVCLWKGDTFQIKKPVLDIQKESLRESWMVIVSSGQQASISVASFQVSSTEQLRLGSLDHSNDHLFFLL